MFKLDKNTHMMVLFTFSLIFIVVYLYYTITDVRKMQKEVRRISDELLKLQTKTPEPPVQSKPIPSPVPTQAPAPAPPPVPIVECKQVEPDAEDDESVLTEEIRETLECTDDEEADIDLQAIINSSDNVVGTVVEPVAVETLVEPVVVSEVVIDEAEILQMKYDDLKDLCKKRNLSQKGAKDVLIKRLLESK